MRDFKNFVGGAWVEPQTRKYEDNINPADTNEVLGRFPASGEEDVQAAIAAARDAFPAWSDVPGSERGKVLYRFADLLEQTADELAEILTKEEGKLLSESKTSEVLRAVEETRFMAGEASRLFGDHYASDDTGVDVVRKRVPLGPVGVITPWNFPVVLPVRKISPAIAYGDTVVFKPATLTPWTGLRLTELYQEAGIPEGVLNTVCGRGSIVGNAIARSEDIEGISFTGSTTIGRGLFETCASSLTKIQLEMGGKNPALVYGAKTLEDAAAKIVHSAFASSGQRCTAISRVLVSRDEHDELLVHMEKRVEDIRVGNGMDPSVGMGPLVSRDQLDTVEHYMKIARDEGAAIRAGGERVEAGTPGYYFAPTLLDGVSPESPLAKEEIFGPILSVLTVDSFEEGLRLCNDTAYGLAASVFTGSLEKAKRFSESVEAGMIHVNQGTVSQPHVPFGGLKQSGFGAYSIGPTSIDFYMNDKVVFTR